MTKQLIDRVTRVIAFVENGNELYVYAEGQTNHAGWKDLELQLRGGSLTDIRFGFAGTPPINGAAVLTEVEASTERPLMPPFPRTVTVVAAHNEITAEIEYVAAKELVSEVTEVKATLDGNMLHVAAKGKVPTAGWTCPELRQIGFDASKFDFVARPPRRPVADVITPIEVEATFGPLLPPFPVDVTVCGAANCVPAPVEIGAAASAPSRSKAPAQANA